MNDLSKDALNLFRSILGLLVPLIGEMLLSRQITDEPIRKAFRLFLCHESRLQLCQHRTASQSIVRNSTPHDLQIFLNDFAI